MTARGNELPHAKLTREKVEAIRVRYLMGVTQRKMAAQYGVHVNTIHRVCTYANWWHLKRAWQVKVEGYPIFTMICMESDDDPYETCRAIFGDRLISVT